MVRRFKIGVWLLFVAAALFGAVHAAQSAVIIEDSFESCDKSATQNGFTWVSASPSTVVATNPKTGTCSLLFLYEGTPPGGDAWQEQRFYLGGQYTELWFKYDVYIPANFYHRTDGISNNKFMYIDNDVKTLYVGFEAWPTITGGAGSDYIPLHLKWDSHDYGHDHPGSNLYGQPSDIAYYVRQDVDKGRWHEWVIHLKLASGVGSGDGVVEMWKNGVKEMEYLHLNNYTPGSNYFSEGYIQGYANSGFAEDTYVYIDDFIVSTSPITPSGGGDITPPTVTSRTIPSAGTTLVLGLDEAVTVAGAVPTMTGCSGGATTLSSPSGSGTATITYTLSRQVLAAETGCVNSYTQPGDGIEDLASNDLASFSAQSVTNSSTQIIVALTNLLPASGTRYRKEVTQATIGVTTDKVAWCRWGSLPFLPWASLTGYNGVSLIAPYRHSTLLSVAAGRVYQICSRCFDTLAQQYSGDACTRFSVRPYRQRTW